MSLPLYYLGAFNSAPVLSSDVNVKTSNDTDSFDEFLGKKTTVGVSEVERKKKQNWSTLFSDNEEDNDSFSPTPVLLYGVGRGISSAKDDRFDK